MKTSYDIIYSFAPSRRSRASIWTFSRGRAEECARWLHSYFCTASGWRRGGWTGGLETLGPMAWTAGEGCVPPPRFLIPTCCAPTRPDPDRPPFNPRRGNDAKRLRLDVSRGKTISFFIKNFPGLCLCEWTDLIQSETFLCLYIFYFVCFANTDLLPWKDISFCNGQNHHNNQTLSPVLISWPLWSVEEWLLQTRRFMEKCSALLLIKDKDVPLKVKMLLCSPSQRCYFNRVSFSILWPFQYYKWHSLEYNASRS